MVANFSSVCEPGLVSDSFQNANANMSNVKLPRQLVRMSSTEAVEQFVMLDTLNSMENAFLDRADSAASSSSEVGQGLSGSVGDRVSDSGAGINSNVARSVRSDLARSTAILQYRTQIEQASIQSLRNSCNLRHLSSEGHRVTLINRLVDHLEEHNNYRWVSEASSQGCASGA